MVLDMVHIYNSAGSTTLSAFLYLFDSTVQVELPPIKMVGIKREIIIFSTVAGVGEDIAATFGEAKKDVSRTQTNVVPVSTNNITLFNPPSEYKGQRG